MSYLKVEIVQANCVYVLQIENPTDTLRRLAMFFQDNHVALNDFNLHRYQDGTAMIIANCLVDKLRTDSITSLLHLLPGVMKVQRLEGKSIITKAIQIDCSISLQPVFKSGIFITASLLIACNSCKTVGKGSNSVSKEKGDR